MGEYVSNSQLYDEIVKYQEVVRLAKEAGEPQPKLPDVIGVAILNICNKLSSRYNFNGYTYRDEMADEAVVYCVAAILKFDTTISKNPFAYLSQVAWRAFLKIMEVEKKQRDIRTDMMKNKFVFFAIDEKDDQDHNNFSDINSDDTLDFRGL